MTALEIISSHEEIKLPEALDSEDLSHYSVTLRRSISAILSAFRGESTTYEEGLYSGVVASQSSSFDEANISAEMAEIFLRLFHKESSRLRENRYSIKYGDVDTSLVSNVESIVDTPHLDVRTSDEIEYHRRYGEMDIDRIREQLSVEDFEIFMNTVGAVEVPVEWTSLGKPIYYGDPYTGV